jgi:carboxypeptidase family protein
MTRRAAARCFALLLWASGCGAAMPDPIAQPAPLQRPPQGTPTTPATPPAPGRPVGVDLSSAAPVMTASLAGVITSSEGGKPLARARITLTAATMPEPRVALTGADGRYEFSRLPAGTYSVNVSRSGYVPQQFGERRSLPPATVPVSAGQKVTGIDVALAPAGVIVGAILDEDGTPFTGARVDALVSRVENGQTALVPASSAETDDKGTFRLTGLAAGQYYVSAFDPAFANVGDDSGPLNYTPTYYPGVVFIEQARRVDVEPGIEPSLKIVFTLQIIRPARVTGTIVTSDRRQLISGAVIMSPIHTEVLAVVPTRDVVILPDGSFEFRNVPPGRYQIRARGEVEPNGTALFATFTVSVMGRDISDVSMTLVPGASVEGSIVVEGARAARTLPAGLRVRAPFADGSSFGDSLTGDVLLDGSYRIRGLMKGTHLITVEGLQYPWTLKSVLYKGIELADVGLDVDSKQEFKDVRVVITDRAAELAGTVRDPRGREAPDAMVLVMPASPQFWTRTSRRFGVLRTDASGRYRLRGLPPGEYRALATFDVDESEAFRQDLIESLFSRGVPVTVRELEQRALDLPLVSLSAARRTVSR